ncbi:MAG: OmpA family protein [Streptosporangiaceae bacterium]
MRGPRLGRIPRLKTGIAALAVALPLPLLVGCRTTPDSGLDVVVVADSATANEPAPVLANADRDFLYHVGADNTDGVAYVVDPSTGQPAVVYLTPRRPDGQVEYAQPRRDQLLDTNVNQVQQVLDREVASGPFDLLADIAAAARVSANPATLLVISSGLSTAGGFELADVGWGADSRLIAAQLKARGLLPDLMGWHVIFSGLGDTAGRQAALPLPERSTLAVYWLAICRAAGAASCSIDETTRPEPPPRSTIPVPVVPVPQVVPIQGPHGWTGENVPADEFFAFDSSQLLPGADSILGPLAASARSGHLLVSITGYASPDGGSDAYNTMLSKERALAVRARLIALGVPAGQIVTCTGLGTDGEPRSACYSGGQLDEAICAQLRRVVILLSPTTAASR